MKTRAPFLYSLCVFTVIASIVACKNAAVDTDSVTISSVSPESGLINSQLTTFTIDVLYNLASTGKGQLEVGFNNGAYQWMFVMTGSTSPAIDSGTGSYQFVVTALAKDWGAAGPFQVLVILSEYPHPPIWSPLASTTRDLTF